MSTTVYFGTVPDDARVLQKTIPATWPKECSCYVYDPCDIYDPRILVDYFDAIDSYNYAYIPEFERYYYIRSASVNSAQRLEIILEEDVLMSFKEQILDVTCVIDRSAWDNKNLYIADSSMILYQFTQTYHHQFSYTFNPFGHIYLSTIG